MKTILRVVLMDLDQTEDAIRHYPVSRILLQVPNGLLKETLKDSLIISIMIF